MQRSATNATTVIVAGLGWGYLIDVLSQLALPAKFIFFEPFTACHAILREQGRLAHWQAAGINYCTSLSEAKEAIKCWQERYKKTPPHPSAPPSLQIHVTPVYARLWPQLAQDLTAKLIPPSAPATATLALRNGRSSIDSATAAHFVHQWVRNAICRFSAMEDREENAFHFLAPKETATRQSQSKNVAAEPLVVYCGAAPTLLTELEMIPKQAFIIASDTALGPIFASGRRAHLAICVDSSYATRYHLQAALRHQKSDKLDCAALSWSGALPDLPRWFRQVYYYRSTLPIDQILALGPLAACELWENPSRNALGLAIHIARVLGATKLYCAGVTFVRDASGRSHVNGSGYQEYALARLQRNYRLEMYRPRGYAAKLYAKTELAWSGAQQLARDLGLCLRAADTLLQLEHEYIPKNAPQLYLQKVPSLKFSGKQLCSFLRNCWPQLDLAQLTQAGLRAERLQRYKQILDTASS